MCACASGLDAGFSASLLRLKLVAVSQTASKPELSAGVGCGVVVPLDYVLAARPWVQDLVAPLHWRQRKKKRASTVSLISIQIFDLMCLKIIRFILLCKVFADSSASKIITL